MSRIQQAGSSLDSPLHALQEQQRRVDALQEERAELMARLGGGTVQVSPQPAGSAYAARESRGGNPAARVPGSDARQGEAAMLSLSPLACKALHAGRGIVLFQVLLLVGCLMLASLNAGLDGATSRSWLSR